MPKLDTQNSRIISTAAFERFNLSALGLGDIKTKPIPIESMAAVFDLGGFTKFCNQSDPQYSVPRFLNGFLGWLFLELRSELVNPAYNDPKKEEVALWCPLPYFVKFMGDGLLVLWNIEESSQVTLQNIVVSCSNICSAYRKDFLPTVESVVTEPPQVLRCGISLGRVFSVGNGEDYIGPSINMASRLQKLGGLSFAFNPRGFDHDEDFFKGRCIAKVSIRGMGENELVCFSKAQYDKLATEDRALFRIVKNYEKPKLKKQNLDAVNNS